MRVLIADDHVLFRRGLRNLLEAAKIEVVGEARNGREAVELARAQRPDIVLMDLLMPEVDGLTGTRLISAELPAVKVVVLTASDEDADVFEAIKSGAQGYVLKDVEPDQLFRLLDGVAHGEPAFTPSLARKVLGELLRPGATRPETAGDALTEREREVLELMVRGITSNHDLAERLTLSESTVKFHLHNILHKLHLQSRAQVVGHALRHGLVRPPERP